MAIKNANHKPGANDDSLRGSGSFEDLAMDSLSVQVYHHPLPHRLQEQYRIL